MHDNYSTKTKNNFQKYNKHKKNKNVKQQKGFFYSLLILNQKIYII